MPDLTSERGTGLENELPLLPPSERVLADVDADSDWVRVFLWVYDLDESAQMNLSELVIKNQWRSGSTELHRLGHGGKRVDSGTLAR